MVGSRQRSDCRWEVGADGSSVAGKPLGKPSGLSAATCKDAVDRVAPQVAHKLMVYRSHVIL